MATETLALSNADREWRHRFMDPGSGRWLLYGHRVPTHQATMLAVRHMGLSAISPVRNGLILTVLSALAATMVI